MLSDDEILNYISQQVAVMIPILSRPTGSKG